MWQWTLARARWWPATRRVPWCSSALERPIVQLPDGVPALIYPYIAVRQAAYLRYPRRKGGKRLEQSLRLQSRSMCRISRGRMGRREIEKRRATSKRAANVAAANYGARAQLDRKIPLNETTDIYVEHYFAHASDPDSTSTVRASFIAFPIEQLIDFQPIQSVFEMQDALKTASDTLSSAADGDGWAGRWPSLRHRLRLLPSGL